MIQQRVTKYIEKEHLFSPDDKILVALSGGADSVALLYIDVYKRQVDFQTLSLYASECGFKAELIKEGKHYDYLVKLSIA